MTSYGYGSNSSNNIYANQIRYPDEITLQKMAKQYEEHVYREQQKAYEEYAHAEKEAEFRRAMELLLHRMAQTEVEVSQLTRRLSMAEAEVRSAKVREGKFLDAVYRLTKETNDSKLTLDRLRRLWEELTDGKRGKETDKFTWNETDLHN